MAITYTLGERIADKCAALIGSWPFILGQSAVLSTWMVLNCLGIIHFDPWPFLGCNIILSLQAAYTGPVLLMASNRQSAIDHENFRKDLIADLNTNERIQELEIKIDLIMQHLGIEIPEHTVHVTEFPEIPPEEELS